MKNFHPLLLIAVSTLFISGCKCGKGMGTGVGNGFGTGVGNGNSCHVPPAQDAYMGDGFLPPPPRGYPNGPGPDLFPAPEFIAQFFSHFSNFNFYYDTRTTLNENSNGTVTINDSSLPGPQNFNSSIEIQVYKPEPREVLEMWVIDSEPACPGDWEDVQINNLSGIGCIDSHVEPQINARLYLQPDPSLEILGKLNSFLKVVVQTDNYTSTENLVYPAVLTLDVNQ